MESEEKEASNRTDWQNRARTVREQIMKTGTKVRIARDACAKNTEPYEVQVGDHAAVKLYGWPPIHAFLLAHAQVIAAADDSSDVSLETRR